MRRMDVRIKATGFQLTPDVGAYLDSRLTHLEKMLGDGATLARCGVELGRDAGRPRHGANIWFAEVTIKAPGGIRARARNNSESINGAIDNVKDEVERQLRSEKRLHMRVLRKTGAAIKRWMKFGRAD